MKKQLRQLSPSRDAKTPDPVTAVKCVLSDPDLDIIPELDHRIGRCLCQLCSCGRHVCPNTKSLKTMAKSTYQSQYRNEFRRFTPDKPLIKERPQYKANYCKLETTTTQKTDFKPFKVELVKETYERPITPSLRFTGMSSYSSEYPNWGPSRVLLQRTPKQPESRTKLRMKVKTAYQETFTPHKDFQRTPIVHSTSSRVFKPLTQPVMQTTNQATFSPDDSLGLNSRVKIKQESLVPQEVTPGHYKTTQQADYLGASLGKKNPQRVKVHQKQRS
jgi:hypothetical protein